VDLQLQTPSREKSMNIVDLLNSSKTSVPSASGPPHRVTIIQHIMQYEKEHTIHEHKMNLRTVKCAQWDEIQFSELRDCSSKCAYYCAWLQYTIQHRTV